MANVNPSNTAGGGGSGKDKKSQGGKPVAGSFAALLHKKGQFGERSAARESGEARWRKLNEFVVSAKTLQVHADTMAPYFPGNSGISSTAVNVHLCEQINSSGNHNNFTGADPLR